MHADLPKQDVTYSALQGLQLMTNEYIKGKAGFYMTLERFSNSRKCERMIAKIKFPVPIHLLDHLIVPVHVRDSHWFPAHMDVKSRCMGFLDSSHAYSSADYHGRKCFGGNSTEWHVQSTLTPIPQLLLGSCTSEDDVAAHTTDRTHTSNGAGTRKAERSNRRQHN